MSGHVNPMDAYHTKSSSARSSSHCVSFWYFEPHALSPAGWYGLPPGGIPPPLPRLPGRRRGGRAGRGAGEGAARHQMRDIRHCGQDQVPGVSGVKMVRWLNPIDGQLFRWSIFTAVPLPRADAEAAKIESEWKFAAMVASPFSLVA